MKMNILKSVLALSCGLLAVAASAAPGADKKMHKPFADADHVIYAPTRFDARLPMKSNLTDHGGGVIVSAKVVYIFWGPSFNNASSTDYNYARTLQAYRNQFGTTPEYNTITQYSGIQLSNLASGTPDWFDTSTPPTNVTDASVQAEVNRYFSGGHGAFNSSTIYEVVIPQTSYSSSGTSTSCGGPSLAYCAYHGSYAVSGGTAKYAIEPYPSCSGCKVSGWSDVQNAEHFVCHEVREAVTDPVNGWWDGSTGEEADDKCAWSPTPFLGTGGYGYQYEWSNLNGGCIATTPIPTGGCGEASCTPVQGTYVSHFSGPGCTGTESYYLPYDGFAYSCRTWNGTGQCGTIHRTVTNYSARINGGPCQDLWTSGNTLSDFVTVYRCGEASCTPVQGTYVSHFSGPNCTGTESYYLPYDGFAYSCRTWNGTGQCGTIHRTVTNYSARINGGACQNLWPSGNTLSDFVTIYH